MPRKYVLVDFENVRPTNLGILSQHPFNVFVFVGSNQSKVPIDLAVAMQALGEKGQYIQIQGNGKNALDFHIAYYIGELGAQDREAQFHIISRDAGFDPLIKHLRKREICVTREQDLGQIPELRTSSDKNSEEKISAIVKNLSCRGQSRPRKVKTLTNTINTLFTKQLAPSELESLVEELASRDYISITEGNVSYKLPKSP